MQDVASGTQTATINTEHTLATITDAGIYVLLVDKHLMQAGDTTQFRRKTKVLTGGTSRVVVMDSFSDAPSADAMIYQSEPPLSLRFSGSFTLKQTAGTGRDYDWRIERIDL